MPRLRITIMCTHFITASGFYMGHFLRISGNTDTWSPVFEVLFTFGDIIGPAVYVIYTATQTVFISFLINKHMHNLTDRADNRGQNFQLDDWMPRLRRLYWTQILLFAVDLISVTATVIANIPSLVAFAELAACGIFFECLAIGYIFIESRGICLTLNASNERQAQAHVKLKVLGRGLRVVELDTVKIGGSPKTPIAGNPTNLYKIPNC